MARIVWKMSSYGMNLGKLPEERGVFLLKNSFFVRTENECMYRIISILILCFRQHGSFFHRRGADADLTRSKSGLDS